VKTKFSRAYSRSVTRNVTLVPKSFPNVQADVTLFLAMRYLTLLSLVSLLQFPAISQDAAPNLSGVWRWNPQKSPPSKDPPAELRVRIEQADSEIGITFRSSGNSGPEEENSARYKFGADVNKNQIHGAPMVSKCAWEGAVLVVHSVATFKSGELRMDDRWMLSPDKQTLTFEESHQFGEEPQPTFATRVFDRQPDGSWEPPKPAEQVYKNIQMMKGVPAPRLMTVMQFFTKSLGVECHYCHVPDEFEKDDKLAKITARKMLNMVHQVNDVNFPGNRIVSCWMCHRGSAKPEAFPK
jgi:hypothetical protein